jgi:hypothetical protein
MFDVVRSCSKGDCGDIGRVRDTSAQAARFQLFVKDARVNNADYWTNSTAVCAINCDCALRARALCDLRWRCWLVKVPTISL